MSLLHPGFDWSSPISELRTILPEEAEWILATRNSCVKPLDESRAAGLAAVIRSDSWDINGETIVFWRNGTLRHGQHRLRACVLAGRPIRTYVVFGTE